MLLLLSCGHLVTDIYQGSLPALLPLLRTKLGLSYAAAGTVLLASNLTSSVIQPLFGFFSDRRSKPLLLPLGCLFAALGLSLLALPSRFAGVLCLVVLSGLGVASYHPEGYRTATGFTGRRAAAGMSIFSVGGNFGFALGPILCLAVVTRLGLGALPLMGIPALLFVALVAGAWPRLVGARTASGGAAESRPPVPRRAWVSLALLIATVMMRSWTQIGLMTYIPFYYIDYLKGDPLYAGKLVSVLLLGGVVGTLVGSPLADRWGHRRYLILSLVATSLLVPLVLTAR
ncbi:MAG: MFS transporter, partial [Deltaproteobacteria bacterium]|nr:MFS transporter [Deltaproteobacteria bacterium]